MADVKKKIKARQGHRTFVEGVIGKSRELITGEITEEVCRKLQVNKRILEGKITLLETVNAEIIDLLNTKDNIEKEIIDSSEFTASIDECIVQIDITLKENDKAQMGLVQPVLTSSTKPVAAKLPKLSLNKFSGNPVDWQAFWDSFNSAVGSNSSLSDVDKFNYLKSLLHGTAAETISGFSLTKENYCEAVKLLQERYGNKQVVISSQMDSLLKLPGATSMSEVKKLRNIYDKLESHVRSLQNIGVAPDTYGSFLAPVVMSKIPEELRIIITRELPSGEWKLEPLLKTFNKELQLREKCALVSGGGQRKDQQYNQKEKGKYSHHYQPSAASLLTEGKNVQQSREGPWCTFCNGNHSSSSCTIVTNISARKQILRRRGKCFKCLKTGHLVRDCKTGRPCYNCGNDHHTSICESNNKPKTPIPRQHATQPQHVNTQANSQFVPIHPSTNMIAHQPYLPFNPGYPASTQHPPSAFVVPSAPPWNNLSNMHVHSSFPPMNPNYQSSFPATQNASATPQVDTGTPSTSMFVSSRNNVLLQTARACVSSVEPTGNSQNIRIIYDSCSQRSYVTERLQKSLNLPVSGSDTLLIKTFGESHPHLQKCNIVQLAIKTPSSGNVYISAYVVPTICSPISNQSIDIRQPRYSHLQSLALADDTNHPSDLHIELLIGADYYWSLVTGEVVRSASGSGPIALSTKLGYVLSGPVEGESSANASTVNLSETHVLKVASEVVHEDTLERDIKGFWDLESIGIKSNEPAVHDKFLNEITFDGERYEVRLPFKENHPPIPDNYQLSKARLESLVRRLKSNPELLKQYDQVIQDQLQANVIESVSSEEVGQQGEVHYLPHREVLRMDKKTTKIRVVYDASAKKNGPSLSDCLYSGPSLTPLIFDILLRFRLKPIGMTGDIEKAFLNVSVAQEDRDYLRFLWLDDITKENPELVIRRFKRVVFGVSSSPFLLNGTINHHISSYQDVDPDFVEEVLKSLYVDDFASSVFDVSEGYLLYHKLKKRFGEGGFNMRKWITSSDELDKTIAIAEGSEKAKKSCQDWEEDLSFSKTGLPQPNPEEELPKVLGLTWDNKRDKLVFGFNELVQNLNAQSVTKRIVLSSIAKVYDPLGLLSPTTTVLKIIFQAVCKNKAINWDDTLDNETAKWWKSAVIAMKETGKIELNRCYCPQIDPKEIKSVELHGFGDASEKAYGGVVYIRTVAGSRVSCQIVASKSKVSPIGGETIPRLELLSGLVLARLISHVKTALEGTYKIDRVICWLDSEIALWWINGTEKEYKVFIQNRVVEIRKLVDPKSWRHVPSEQNPADILSRGSLASYLKEMHSWWFGPEFLEVSESCWPKSIKFPRDNFEEGECKEAHFVSTILVQNEKPRIGELIDCQGCSDYEKLVRVTCYVVRFVKNLRMKKEHRPSSVDLSKVEISEAEALWIQEAQRFFRAQPEYKQREISLRLFEDEDGILRSRGRLDLSHLPYSTRNPAILPRNHHVTKLIIRNCHDRVMHNGVNETLVELRAKYWIVKGRQEVKKIISRCTTCKRIEGKCYGSPPPPPLPQFRVSEEFAYTHLGVDFAGPVYVRNIYSQAKKTYKAYIALYTCASTRGIHLELTPDLSAQAFVRSLQRFIGRRGVPSFVVSDNGKTFRNSIVKKFVRQYGINWNFNVPYAPWWGGFFERLVRSVKRCLKKTLGNARVSFEEFETVLIQVEGILNSRPLTYVNEELGEPLTPSNLCIGRRLLSPSSMERKINDNIGGNIVKREKFLSRVLNHFWARWRKEYLTELREHHKARNGTRGVTISRGDIVVVHEDKVPRQLWRVAKVEDLIRGRDGNVRAATVRVLSGERTRNLQRPIQRLYPIEISGKEREVVPDITFVPDEDPEGIQDLNT